MQKQILESHYEQREPCVIVAFSFEKLDLNVAKKILEDLRLGEPAEVYHGDHPQILFLQAYRTGAKYHLHATSVVVLFHYDFNSDLWHNPHHLEEARKAVRTDAAKLIELMEFTFSVFDK